MKDWILLFWRLMASVFMIAAVVSKHYGASWEQLNNTMLWVVCCLLFILIEEKN